MEEAVQIVTAICSMVGVVVVAYLAYLTQKLSKEVAVVKHNTNSLTEQLVKSTGDASFAAGRESGRKSEAKKLDDNEASSR